MSPYALFFLAALLLIHAVDVFSRWLNSRSLDPRLPEEFQGVFGAEAYRRSQEYERTKTRFDVLQSSAGLAVLLVFWFVGGFERLDAWVRGWALSEVLTGLSYIGLLFLANEAVSLPFEVYRTFVIEERFGFNKTSPRLFAADRLKSYGLAALIGGPLLALILFFFGWAGDAAWAWAWGAAAVFRVLLQLVGPTWIMPLFNKFTPLPDGELRDAIFRYAASVGFPLRNIFVMDGSKRSSKTNAFFSGFGKNKRIALFDTLIDKHAVEELVAVIAHEIGHYKRGHVWKGMALSLANYGLLFYLLSLFVRAPVLFEAFGVTRASVYVGLLLFGICYAPVSFLLAIATQAFSRRNEYQADRYAAETVADRNALVRALKTLSVSNLSNLTPHPLFVFLHYTHPPVLRRIAALRAAPSAG
ncbi:MAG TPA: M48 family metallopeptidase [Elusimicrobiota bacterium]|nr:M48 family metallopeptidase [Elusimicrobiota bacterium]